MSENLAVALNTNIAELTVLLEDAQKQLDALNKTLQKIGGFQIKLIAD